MGMSSTTNRLVYAGNGSSTAFSFPYYFFAQADMVVYLYDTVAGTAVLQVITTNYTISGTPSFQGVYPSGANVVMGVAPTATQFLVLVRVPIQTQTFSILQNGIIPSAALIQELDYLTALIQRLQDQASRAVSLPDGMGATFSPLLPVNTALVPNGYFQVNSAGTGIQLSPGTGNWQKSTIAYTSVQTGALTNQLTLFTLPAKGIITGLAVKHSTLFSGGAIATCVVQLGIVGQLTKFVPSFDIKQAVADQAFTNVTPGYIGSWASGTAITANFISTGANLSALTQGSVDIEYQYQLLA